MRNKGAIITVSVLLTVICLYYLSFTFMTKRVESKADNYAEARFESMKLEVEESEKIYIVDSLTKRYLDSMSNQVVYTLFKKYTYMDCKEREMNLGLDLKGGMNITLEISAQDVIKALSNNQSDSTLIKAIELANAGTIEQTGTNYIEVFGNAFSSISTPNSPSLASLFITTSNQEDITIKSSNEEVIAYIRNQYDAAINNAFDVLRKRIDHFGVVQPNIQRDVAVKGVFHIELPGIKDPERVEELLRQAAVLEFWETYNAEEIYDRLSEANILIAEIKDAEQKEKDRKSGKDVEKEENAVADEIIADEVIAVEVIADEVIADEVIADEVIGDEVISELIDAADKTSSSNIDSAATSNANALSGLSLFERLRPQVGNVSIYGPIVGYAKEGDMASIMADLNRESVKRLFPSDLVFAWGFKPSDNAPGYYELIALKKSNDGRAVLNGDVITDAKQEFGQNQAIPQVTMTMNGSGSTEWARITRAIADKYAGSQTKGSIAIVLDGYAYSWPTVSEEITGGRSMISGNFTLDEATDLANVLKSGKMPAPANILSKEIVGPSLGNKAINDGLNSFVIAFILVLIYMIFYYGKAGIVADIALITNLFLIFGVLASLGAVLTLPGIAGIVLTIGMSVDANVLIYERIREEMRAGKTIKSAISDGYKNAYSAIIDSNVTTLLIGIILLNFGVGPVKGFATTLIIGILSSLFTAIFITRIVISTILAKDRKMTFGNKLTLNAFQNLNIDFINKRKISYVISSIIILISLVSLFTRGLNPGIDFTGGRNYIVAFDQAVVPNEIGDELEKIYGDRPLVKTFGGANQVKISTNYKIDDNSADNEADSLLYIGLKPMLGDDVSMAKFFTDYRQTSQKVGPTVADDIKSKSIIAITLGLIVMFLYILLRFRKWQYSLGALISLIHDVIIVLGLYSLLFSIMPFNMELDQAFIAAILTVVGYSINDTVVVFDRLREFLGIYKKRKTKEVMNSAINATVSRTINTSLSTFVVLLAIFIFGGEVIRGFTFALLIGVIIGTYSSIFVATPIAFDLMKKNKTVK
ncbi:MAG: protein translocase subunit SecDF [Bacteroidales bacterium]|nr:protein translocase subunit SecDF [Bacteroidales bacterium]